MLTLATGLMFFNLLFAHNGDPNTPSAEVKKESGISLKDIFLSDYDGITLFVDFQAVTDDILELNVRKEGALVLADDVRDLPNNTIYELNLEVLSTGNYSLELKTAAGITIQKDVVIE